MTRRERRAAAVGKLIGVQLDRQAERLGLAQNLPGLCNGERDALAKDIDRIGKRRSRRHDLIAYEGDVIVRAALEFLGKRVRAKERGLDRQAR